MSDDHESPKVTWNHAAEATSPHAAAQEAYEKLQSGLPRVFTVIYSDRTVTIDLDARGLNRRQAYEIASQWGSLMTSGDPGACFYGFEIDDGRPQDEAHRLACMAYTKQLISEQGNNSDPQNLIDLQRLESWFEACSAITQMDWFTKAYINCALWSSTDNEDDSGGAPLDENYDATHLSDETMKTMIDDCKDFQSSNSALLERAVEQEGYDLSNAGHDFWLTRNGHGAGFWDRGLDDVGDELTRASKAYGSVDLYVGDDGLIHT